MAGRFQGLTDLEWLLFADLFQPPPEKLGRGRPTTPIRYLLNTLLDVLITGSRWCDVPKGKQWGARSSSHRALQAWTEDGTLDALKARILGIAQEEGLINGSYGAIDGSFSPWEGRW